jgi:hypothetical protein
MCLYMSVYVYVCIYVHVSVYVCMCVCVYICVYTCVGANVCMYVVCKLCEIVRLCWDYRYGEDRKKWAGLLHSELLHICHVHR